MAGINNAFSRGTCQVEGCHRNRRSKGSLYCEAHYYRLRRTGTLDLRPPKPAEPVLLHPQGYRRLLAPHHPLAVRRGSRYEYEHRAVFYDAHGEGPFACHVCGKQVGWQSMHVDHLNDQPDDNRVENLAPACPTCNQWRGRHKMVATLKDRRGTWIEHDGQRRTLGEWAEHLGIARSALRFRLARWPLAEALTKSRGTSGPPSRTARQAHGAG